MKPLLRWTRLLLALLIVAIGIAFGALNHAPLVVDLHFVQVEASSGVALLAAALVGAVLAGLCLGLAVIWPLRRALRRAARERALEDALPVPVERDPS